MSHVTVGAAADGGDRHCFAVAGPGLAPLVRDELVALNGMLPIAVGEPEPGGVPFQTGLGGIYAANLHLRIASRILVRIGGFHASGFAELERHAARLPWGQIIGPGMAVEFRVTSRKSRLYHQDAVAERLRAAAARAGAAVAGGVAGDAPPQEFMVRLYRDQCTVSADASGELLHRRGYRLASAKAPLRETLAAAAVVASEWDGTGPRADPMCGSGTIPIEAALLARRIPPGLARRFAFMAWPGFDAAHWAEALDRGRDRMLPRASGPILGADRDAGAVAAAGANAERAGVAGDIVWTRASISAFAPPSGPGWLVTNPPYGVRLGERARLRDLYAQLGNVARRSCPGWQVALFAAYPELERQVGLGLTPRFATENGGLRVRLVTARVP